MVLPAPIPVMVQIPESVAPVKVSPRALEPPITSEIPVTPAVPVAVAVAVAVAVPRLKLTGVV